MKTIIAVLACVVLSLSAFAQTTNGRIEFHYDDGGNRILRHEVELKMETEENDTLPPGFVNDTILYTGMDNSTGMEMDENDDFEDESLNFPGSDIKIYPNPTKGYVYINLGFEPNKKVTLRIFDTNGRLVEEKIATRQILAIDLSSSPDGVYILDIVSEGQKRQTKILKNQ